MRQDDTPPTSPLMEEEEEEIYENDVVYIGDIDEVINAGDEEDGDMGDMEEMEEDGQERNDASCIFSKHSG